jgi:nucleoside-diphosphate-sugar epimerase
MTVVLVTGAGGFVGRALCAQLARQGLTVRAARRTEHSLCAEAAQQVTIGEIGSTTEWGAALEGVDFVVHAAARTHVLRDSPAAAPLYAEVNAAGTAHLARAAARAGVRRFLFLSSIKVNGETTGQHKFRSNDVPAPADEYGRSKLAAEIALASAAAGTAMQAAVIRPPLVYGAGVRANFLRLLGWVDRGRPLPFGAISNARSLVSVWNLSDLLGTLLTTSRPVSGVWLVSDGEDLSTPDLILRLGRALGRPVHLPRVPPQLLRWGAALARRSAEIDRLCSSLQVDATPTRTALDWTPPLSVDAGLERTAAWYLREGRL